MGAVEQMQMGCIRLTTLSVHVLRVPPEEPVEWSWVPEGSLRAAPCQAL